MLTLYCVQGRVENVYLCIRYFVRVLIRICQQTEEQVAMIVAQPGWGPEGFRHYLS